MQSVPEFDLLLSCLQMKWRDDGRALLTAKLAQSWDWERFMQIVVQRGMAPFLYGLVQEGGVPSLPTTVKAQLWAYYRLCAEQNSRMADEVVQLVSELEAVGVTAVPLKGVVLAAAVYGDVAHRWSSDIDLWVRRSQLDVCMEQLEMMGYVGKRPFTDAQEQMWRQINYEQTWINQERQFVVDLHWHLTPLRLTIPFEPTAPLLNQPLANGTVSIFSPEDQLLYLCLHGYKHGWQKLSWIVDIACLIDMYSDLAWTAVLAQAKQMHIQRIVRLGLLLGQQLLNVQLPEHIQTWVAEDKRVATIAQMIVSTRLARLDFAPDEQYTWAEHRYLMAGRERLRDKLWFTIRRGFTLSEHDLNNYPFAVHHLGLYLLIRPFRFLYFLLFQRRSK